VFTSEDKERMVMTKMKKITPKTGASLSRLLLPLLLFVLLLASGAAGASAADRMERAGYKGPYVTLNSGYIMPMLGLGTWTLSDKEAEQSVYAAIEEGYRLIDTARYYGNEEGVGAGVRRAIAEGIVTREEIFVTSKIMPSDYNAPDSAIDASNSDLGLGYIDLMLIHQPGRNDKEVYQALERGVKAGKIRSIGLSNYYTPEAFDAIARNAEIVPAVVQNENHPCHQNLALQEHLKQYNTVLESWYPLGGRSHVQELLRDAAIRAIAESHDKTPAQVILRWHIQAGFVAIPGSRNVQHIAENIAIFDFKLSDREMQIMKELNKNKRYENW